MGMEVRCAAVAMVVRESGVIAVRKLGVYRWAGMPSGREALSAKLTKVLRSGHMSGLLGAALGSQGRTPRST